MSGRCTSLDHDLLWRVWREFPESRWGEDAFLRLLRMGWDTSHMCQGGEVQYRRVIELAEQFLAEHPESRHRRRILFTLAQAHETKWSVFKAGPEDIYARDPRTDTDEAQSALKRAIELYSGIATSAPDRPEAAYARRQVPRLKLGILTDQRRFFCIHD